MDGRRRQALRYRVSVSQDTLSTHTEGVLIRVWAVPRSSRSEIKGTHDGRIRIRVAAPPAGGEANRAIAELLSGRLGTEVELVSGAGSREKVFLARAVDIEIVSEKLGD
jgi:uncharacterized protein (TIGR00251 family)